MLFHRRDFLSTTFTDMVGGKPLGGNNMGLDGPFLLLLCVARYGIIGTW